MNKEIMMAMAKGMIQSQGFKSKPNGIKCPYCEEELVDSEPGVIHKNPDRIKIKCIKCDKKGWRYLDDEAKVEI